MNKARLNLPSALALSLCLLLSGCDDTLVADEARHLTGIGFAEQGVVATVNEHPIYLRQVEALTDMNAPSMSSAQATDVESLWADYAQSLYELITQELIRQELARHDLTVAPEEVLKLERLVGRGYGLDPGPELDAFIEELGLSPEYWRDQLRARLEQELWENELLKSNVFSTEEIEDYIAQHPGIEKAPELMDFVLVEGTDREALEKQRKAGNKDLDALRAAGFEVFRNQIPVAAIPELWQKDIASMRAGQLSSSLQQSGMGWAYIIFLGKTPERARTPMERYSLAERALGEASLPGVFSFWLDSALAAAEVKVARQLLPKNVPPRRNHTEMLFPWEQLPLDVSGEDGLGEVEGEEDYEE